MRTIGILGGMSWESSLEYYRLINRGAADRLGGLHSAPLLLHSFDFAEIAAMQGAGDWKGLARLLGDAAKGLADAGAEGMLIATNTMHLVAAEVEAACSLPVLHIAQATGEAARAAGCARVGLLGTRFTMETGVYADELRNRFGIETLIPNDADRDFVHHAIYEELVRGVFSPETRQGFRRVIARLAEAGAEGVILGCTEIPLLVKSEDATVPLFDTTTLHCRMAVEWMLS